MIIRIIVTYILLISFLKEVNAQTTPQITVARLTGNNGTVQVNDVKRDPSGNIVVTGYFTYTTDFDHSPTVRNLVHSAGNFGEVFLAKYDPAGNYLWAMSVPNTNSGN